jgi:cell division septum initiation protein DivIVA
MPDQSSAATEHAILQEITAPLETLPDDPLSVIVADFPVSLRGYDRMAVDEYVRHTRQLVAELQATRSPEAAVRRALERVGEQIAGVLQRAHDTAEQITAQSRREAEGRLEQARVEGNHIAEAAEQRVKELDADTDRIWLERQRIVADAEDLAGQLLALAKVAADRFPTDDEDDETESAPPYDDAALVAGTPVEAGAPEAEDEPDYGFEQRPEDEHDYGLEQQPEGQSDHDDIERTVAFSPLPLSEDQTTILPDTDEPTQPVDEAPEGADDAPPARQDRMTDDESTSVIRPASQAANRRLGGQ